MRKHISASAYAQYQFIITNSDIKTEIVLKWMLHLVKAKCYWELFQFTLRFIYCFFYNAHGLQLVRVLLFSNAQQTEKSKNEHTDKVELYLCGVNVGIECECVLWAYLFYRILKYVSQSHSGSDGEVARCYASWPMMYAKNTESDRRTLHRYECNVFGSNFF